MKMSIHFSYRYTMSEVADLVNQLESLAGNLKTKSASTKVTDIPQEASKKLETIILELQRVQGDIGGRKQP